MTFLILGVALLLIIGFLAWASAPWSLGDSLKEAAVRQFDDVVIETEEEPAVIKVLTWNLGWLYGQGSEGPGYEYREKDFFDQKLKTLADEIKAWGPDVICLQEVDFHSYRSHFVNQAEELAKLAGYPYLAQAPSWESNYIPFPYWPFKNHFGRMNSGGAILSRYPISSHRIELLAKPMTNPWWYNLFYLHRYLQHVSIDFGGGKVLKFVNLHLEAFDKDNRQEQIKRIVQMKEPVDVLAGDFNMVPENALKKRKLTGGDDYENDLSFTLMKRSKHLEVIPAEIYEKDEVNYFTFPAWKPDRRLDYIFYQQGHKMMKAEVLPSKVSDHLPIRASFQIRAPKVNPFQL